MFKNIHLSNSQQVAVVDADHFKILNKYNWCLWKGGNTFYARTITNGRTVYMHQLVLGTSKSLKCDHINKCGLDNRIKNLRLVSTSQNALNSKHRKNNKSGYRGVYFETRSSRWIVHLQVNKRRKYIGAFKNKKDAAVAYNKAAKKYYKEFAQLNII